ncbi:MAG: MBL fold metallo-hydrolase, partial [Acidobacteriota bacterium]
MKSKRGLKAEVETSMRGWQKALVATGVATALGAALERWVMASPHYEGPPSDHYDGRMFLNFEKVEQRQESFLEWRMTRKPGHWPDFLDAPYGPAPPSRVDGGAVRVTFVNHATLLIQMDGVNILTDPIWSDRTSPVSFVGPRRHRPPGIRFGDLPPIDAVLVSHNHYDHLDVATLRRLRGRDQMPIITPLGNDLALERYGIEGGIALDWWSETRITNRVRVTVVPARHFSSRGLSDRNANLWGGFVISGPSGNVYFAGDTGWGRHFEEIGRRFSPIRAALLPIGSYLPRWFMHPVHIDPAQAVDAHLALRAQTSIAMHYGTFALGDDGMLDPVHDLQRALVERGNPRFWILAEGEGREV